MSADPRQIGSTARKGNVQMGSQSEPILPTEIWVALLGLFPPRVLLDERLQQSHPPILPIPPYFPLSSMASMFNDHIYPPAKDYMSQPLCSLQIIQLVECSPPPPSQLQQQKYSPSRLSSSSSSYSESDSDSDDDDGSAAYDSSSSSLSAGSSYCSSEEEDNAAPPMPPSLDNRDPSIDDTYHTRQRRVSLWRDAVYSTKNVVVTSTTPASPSSNTPGSCPPSLSSLTRWGKYSQTKPGVHTAPRPASPSQKRKTPDGDLANHDSVVSSFRSATTGLPFHRLDAHALHSHVRPSTPHASPPAPH